MYFPVRQTSIDILCFLPNSYFFKTYLKIGMFLFTKKVVSRMNLWLTLMQNSKCKSNMQLLSTCNLPHSLPVLPHLVL